MTRFALAAAGLLIVLGASFAPAPPAQEAGNDVEKILAEAERAPVEDLWALAPRLEKLGRPALDRVNEARRGGSPPVRLVCCIVLYRAELRDAALEGFGQLVREGPAELRRAAAHVASILVDRDRDPNPGRKEQFEKLLNAEASAASKGEDRRLEVALWLADWRLSKAVQPGNVIRRIFGAAAGEVKDDAALALAEMERYPPEVKRHLRDMAISPTGRGRLAASYLQVIDLKDQLEAAVRASGSTEYPKEFALLKDVIDKLKANYVDPSKIDMEKLVRNAARGLCADIDQYTAYYDEKMIEELKEVELEGHYGGIGARVAMKRDRAGASWLTVVEPIFSGPAYKEGIRSGDTIVSIEGESTVNRDLQLLVKRLRGPEGTKVKFKVFSRRWRESREFELTRRQIELETTLARMLPGNVGYVALTTFGERNTREVREAVRALSTDGMRALVLDLRGNSGGYLDTAWRIADLFLPKGALVVSSRGRSPQDVEEYRARNGAITEVPMVVLVDELSASASEILAGALQAHKRATLVGKKTFGKGSVQKLKPLEASGGATAVRVTVAKWYLEGNVSVEKDDPTKNGIEPDVTAEPRERDLWLEAETDRLSTEGKLEAYVREHYDAAKERFDALAEYDGGDPNRYPGFDGLYASLATKADRNQIRELLREEVRRKAADARGKAFPCDYETDVVLQRGIVEILKKVGVDHTGIEQYKNIVIAPPVAKDLEKPQD
jgi:carboxyl-terminal processing protease